MLADHAQYDAIAPRLLGLRQTTRLPRLRRPRTPDGRPPRLGAVGAAPPAGCLTRT